MEEHAYKLIVIGDSGVGKSNITLRFCDNRFFEDGVATLGIDFKYTTCALMADERPSSAPKRLVRLQVWDTAGHDRFATLTAGFYRSCQGIMLCFDLTNRSSFEHLDVWHARVRENVGDRVPPVILVGCKVDLVEEAHVCTPAPQVRPGTTGLLLRGDNYGFSRQVETAEAEAWARSHDALCYIETSAKMNVNVARAFELLATCVADSCTPQPPLCDSGNAPRKMVKSTSSPSSKLPRHDRSMCPC
jgi:Rab family, other